MMNQNSRIYVRGKLAVPGRCEHCRGVSVLWVIGVISVAVQDQFAGHRLISHSV